MNSTRLVEFDPVKDASNQQKHGISLARFAEIDFDTALAAERDLHGEVRRTTVGRIGDRLYVGISTQRGGRTRVISLRKANRREERRYVEATTRS